MKIYLCCECNTLYKTEELASNCCLHIFHPITEINVFDEVQR